MLGGELVVVERGDLVVFAGELAGAEADQCSLLVISRLHERVGEHPLGALDVAGLVPQVGGLDHTGEPIGVGLGGDAHRQLGEVGGGGDGASPPGERRRLGNRAGHVGVGPSMASPRWCARSTGSSTVAARRWWIARRLAGLAAA